MEARFGTGGAVDAALGAITISQKIKEMEHAYYFRAFTGAYF